MVSGNHHHRPGGTSFRETTEEARPAPDPRQRTVAGPDDRPCNRATPPAGFLENQLQRTSTKTQAKALPAASIQPQAPIAHAGLEQGQPGVARGENL